MASSQLLRSCSGSFQVLGQPALPWAPRQTGVPPAAPCTVSGRVWLMAHMELILDDELNLSQVTHTTASACTLFRSAFTCCGTMK